MRLWIWNNINNTKWNAFEIVNKGEKWEREREKEKLKKVKIQTNNRKEKSLGLLNWKRETSACNVSSFKLKTTRWEKKPLKKLKGETERAEGYMKDDGAT